MISWLFAGVVLVGVASLLYWYGSRPIYYRGQPRDSIERFVRDLIAQGGDGSLLIICHEGSDRFVQFAKYIISAQKRNLRFGFPDAPWSRNYFEPVKEALLAEGFLCSEEHMAESDVRRFLVVDNIRTSSDASQIAAIAFSAMGLDADATYAVNFEGPVSLAEWKRYVQLLRSRL